MTSALTPFTSAQYSPEKAGVGGSIPSLATIFNNLQAPQKRRLRFFSKSLSFPFTLHSARHLGTRQ
jgi:hypothetical protein